MPTITKKRITDLIINLKEKFSQTDDSRIDPTVLGQLIDNVRAELIIKSFEKDGQIDRSWLTDMGLCTFHSVNFADDPNVEYSVNTVSKFTIPNVISLKKGGADLGIYMLKSPCGTKDYSYLPLPMWNTIPQDHVRSKLPYYDRINTALYVNQKVTKLRPVLILESPEDGYIVNSTPVESGSIAASTVYKVKNGTVVYRGVPYGPNDEFTGNVADATFVGTGTVYLKSQLTSIAETSAYPVSADMARQIVLEICVKEFKIEESQVADRLNNSVDDRQ